MDAGGRIVNVSSGLGALSDIPSDAYRQRVESAGSLDELRGISFVQDDSGCLKAVEPGYPSIGVPVYRYCSGRVVLQPPCMHYVACCLLPPSLGHPYRAPHMGVWLCIFPSVRLPLM
jgi:hypothetical protein